MPANKQKRTRTSWKPGQSGNPKGRPAEGQSWSSIIRGVTDLPAEKLARMVGGSRTELGRSFLTMPKGVPLKTLLVMRVCTATMFDPSPGLLRVLTEVEEWKEIVERLEALENNEVKK